MKTPAVPKTKAEDFPALTYSGGGSGVFVEDTNFNVGFSREIRDARLVMRSSRSAATGRGELMAANFWPPGRSKIDRPAIVPRADRQRQGLRQMAGARLARGGFDQFDPTVDSLVRRPNSKKSKIEAIVTTVAARRRNKLKTIWTIHGDGSVDMDAQFEPFGQLPLLPRIGVRCRVEPSLGHLQWLRARAVGELSRPQGAAQTWGSGPVRWTNNTFPMSGLRKMETRRTCAGWTLTDDTPARARGGTGKSPHRIGDCLFIFRAAFHGGQIWPRPAQL